MQTLPFLEKLIHYLSKENILECVRACVRDGGREAGCVRGRPCDGRTRTRGCRGVDLHVSAEVNGEIHT